MPQHTQISQKVSNSSPFSNCFLYHWLFSGLAACIIDIYTVRVWPKVEVRYRFSNGYGGALLAFARSPHWGEGQSFRDRQETGDSGDVRYDRAPLRTP